MQISWKQKLSSKKFWCALIAAVAAVGAAVGLSDGSVEKITSIVGAFATLITYILVEGNIDAKRVEAEAEAGGVALQFLDSLGKADEPEEVAGEE